MLFHSCTALSMLQSLTVFRNSSSSNNNTNQSNQSLMLSKTSNASSQELLPSCISLIHSLFYPASPNHPSSLPISALSWQHYGLHWVTHTHVSIMISTKWIPTGNASLSMVWLALASYLSFYPAMMVPPLLIMCNKMSRKSNVSCFIWSHPLMSNSMIRHCWV